MPVVAEFMETLFGDPAVAMGAPAVPESAEEQTANHCGTVTFARCRQTADTPYLPPSASPAQGGPSAGLFLKGCSSQVRWAAKKSPAEAGPLTRRRIKILPSAETPQE